jgi:phosphate transport system permease protein
MSAVLSLQEASAGRAANARRRRVVSGLACGVCGLTVVIALVPLVAVLGYTVVRGAGRVTGHFFTTSMRGVGPLDPTGGILHSIIGTLEQVGLATLLAVPLGLMVAVYRVEYGARSRFGQAVRFLVDVMTGIPSIVAGLFVYTFWVLGLHQGYSGFAAALALMVLMLPIVARASEEMLKLVPQDLREASYALGAARWRTILSIVLPTASAGLTTAVMLAVARVTGETAPLLLTAFGFDSVHANPFHGPQSALPLFVYGQAGSPFKIDVDRAWGAALTLIVMVVLLTVVARLVTRRSRVAVT